MSKALFIAAGALSAAVAALHLAIIIVGAPGYRYFGAGERMASMAEQGSWLPAIMTLGIVAVFAIFALYAWSAAGLSLRLPRPAAMLVIIGAAYTLRGLLLVPELVWLSRVGIEPRMAVFSAVSLLIGICYLAATVLGWQSLVPARSRSVRGEPGDRQR